MKPMLAATPKKLGEIEYPCYVSPKYDGVRCLFTEDGVPLSRKLKMYGNRMVSEKFGGKKFAGLDGELVWGSPTAVDVFHRTESVLSTYDHPVHDLKLYVFDIWNKMNMPFDLRQVELKAWLKRVSAAEHIVLVPQHCCEHEDQLMRLEEHYVGLGYEGVMARSPIMPYKFGRSTVREQGLLKVKRFLDSDAEIIDFEEEMRNDNEAKLDNLGHMRRSSHQANMAGKGTLGSFIVMDLKTKVTFKVGSGFTADQRAALWKGRTAIKGAIIKYRYQPVGVKDKPRFPVFLGFRSDA